MLAHDENFGSKHHSASMQPTMNMDASAKSLNLQANLKTLEVEENIYQDYHFSNKTWLTLPTASFTTTFAKGLLTAVMDQQKHNKCKRVGTNLFQVFFKSAFETNGNAINAIDDYSDITTAPIP